MADEPSPETVAIGLWKKWLPPLSPVSLRPSLIIAGLKVPGAAVMVVDEELHETPERVKVFRFSGWLDTAGMA